MINPRKYVVFYRDLPAALASFVSRDGHMTISKDGLHCFEGLSVPRLTVTVESTKSDKDKDRTRKLERILDELETNNQIMGWS